MAIYQVARATIHCDECQRFMGEIKGDKAAIVHLERLHVRCTECGATDHSEQDILDVMKGSNG